VKLLAARARDSSTGTRIPRDRVFAARNLELVSHQGSFFASSLFRSHGVYRREYRIRMDFEWMLRLPRTINVCWVDRDIVRFAGRGVSSTRPWRSSMEELRALRLHRQSPWRIASLLVLYLPWRVGREAWRRTQA
jgi:hypothetical protein